MNAEELQAAVKQYTFYHVIDLGQGVVTQGSPFDLIWSFIERNLESVDVLNKDVIDIGCRDGKFSLLAERRGARRVIGVDNDISKGAVELIIPHLQSKVTMYCRNLYGITPNDFGMFDVTMMFGLVYHLRYPFSGLRAAVNITNPGGVILIEGGMFRGAPKELPMLYCPFKEGNPYEPGSISYFNDKGLIAAMDSFGCTCERSDSLPGSEVNPGHANEISRGFFVFRRTHEMPEYLAHYWEGTHREHSTLHT